MPLLDPSAPPERLAGGVWRIPLPDPFVPGVTASFLLDSPRGAWLVDVGTDTEACEAALVAGIAATGHRRAALRGALLTHAHLDHAGGLFRWSPPALVVHRDAAREMRSAEPRSSRGPAALRRMGVPEARIATLAPHGEPVAERPLPAHLISRELEGDAGEVPDLPGWGWLLAGGHAPGHLLLFHRFTGSLVCGDQFLERWKTPYVISDPDVDSFGAYLRSVDAALALRPRALFPSHTTGIEPAVPWLEERRRALGRLVERTEEGVRAGARTADDLVERLYPTVGSGGLRVLLLREQLAVLRHLAAGGTVRGWVEAGVERFAPAG